jgi:hypothetical protein
MRRFGSHALNRGHRARAPLRTVHARGVELHDAVGVGQAAVADAGVGRVEFVEVDARDHGVEHVGALGHHLKGLLDGGQVAAVLVAVAVRRSDDHRFGSGARQHARHQAGLRGDQASGRTTQDEVASRQSLAHGCLLESISIGR